MFELFNKQKSLKLELGKFVIFYKFKYSHILQMQRKDF